MGRSIEQQIADLEAKNERRKRHDEARMLIDTARKNFAKRNYGLAAGYLKRALDLADKLAKDSKPEAGAVS